MLFILVVCAANFAIGFALAVQMGHGPANIAAMFTKKPKTQSAAHGEAQPAQGAH
jgi:hypothetical protein